MSRSSRKQKDSHSLAGCLVTARNPEGAAAEAYRTLRGTLLFTQVELPLQVVAVVSPGHGEGKTTTCANLGVVLAQANRRTLLLDCDLRGPDLHEVFGLPASPGLAEALEGKPGLHEVQHEARPDLKVMAAGTPSTDAAELLGFEGFARLLEDARREFDFVILDTPPATEVFDPAIIATQADGVLLVLDADNTSRNSMAEAMSRLEAVGARILGTVVNNANAKRFASY